MIEKLFSCFNSLILIHLIFSCDSNSKNSRFEHDYPTYWEKYSDQQLIDSLYSDTLKIGLDSDGRNTSFRFYRQVISELIVDLQEDRKNKDSLYPKKPFDKVTIQTWPIGRIKQFNSKQISQFLEIINNPNSFDWSETTFETAYHVNFHMNNELVTTLSVNSVFSVVQPTQDWPKNKQFKFGGLKNTAKDELTKLVKQIYSD